MSGNKSPTRVKQKTLSEMIGSPVKRRKELPYGVPGDKPKSLEEVLQRMENGLPGEYEEQLKIIRDVASDIMGHFTLHIGNQKFKIVECEAYVYHDNHKDIYTHRQPEQLLPCTWYFHRMGNGSYKSGTYKGMDLTAGNKDCHVGILIRSVRDLSTNKMIEGPCLVVNNILEICSSDSIKEFVEKSSGNVSATENEFLHLRLDSNTVEAVTSVYSAPRVGLTLRKGNGREKFCTRSYRFSPCPWRIAKFKSGFAASAISDGVSEAAVSDMLQLKPKMSTGYAAATQKGLKKKSPGDFYDKTVTVLQLAEMVGACRHLL